MNQYLEVGCQTDDGQMTEFISLSGGQLGKRGSSLCSSTQEQEIVKKRHNEKNVPE